MTKQMVFNVYALMPLLWLTVVICPAYSQAALLIDPKNKHNMSYAATHGGPEAMDPNTDENGTDQICIFCHTPHAAAPESTLWSRLDPQGPNGDGSFPLYAQPLAIKGSFGVDISEAKYTNADKSSYPNGASRMCLSCHDGATAIGILRDNTTIAMAGGQDFVTGSAVIDLSTSHPISFVYTAPVRDKINVVRSDGYQLPDTTDTVDTPLDGQSRMQCTTCHDPHDDTRVDNALWPPFWREGSATGYDDVCGACHTKATTGSPPIHSLP